MSADFFSPTYPAQTQPTPAASIALNGDTAQSARTDSGVVLDLRNDLSEAELEAHIRDLGRLADRAYKDGDPHGARLWTDRMYAAIRGRSPAHQARIQAEIDRRIDGGVCYFMAEGDKTRRRRLTHKD